MPRFFVNESEINDHTIKVMGDNFNHITNVLRYKVGDEITISDGNGMDYLCIIKAINKDDIITNIVDIISNDAEPSIQVTLYQALPKADKMELIIQKCIEIGVTKIVPVVTEHTIVNISNKESKKLARWNKIAESAAKQCGRGIIPIVDNVATFKEAIKDSTKLDKVIIPYEREKENSLKSIIKDFKGSNIGIFIGPEGGFSNAEINLAIDNGVQPITLGKRILRTETAGMVTLAILLHELEN